MNFETKYEFKTTTEPETNPEWATSLSDASDWDSLAEVPFAGDLLDASDSDMGIQDADVSGILDDT